MLTVYSSNIALHPALHNFPTYMRDMCERLFSICVSLSLSGNWLNASMHAVFDGRLLLHADETNIV